MKTHKPALAATEVLLVIPAALFMTALVVRSLQPQQYEPAHTAQRIVDWYAARPHLGLWVLLAALPFIVLFTGAITLLRSWRADAELRRSVLGMLQTLRAQFSTVLVALATFAAACILAIVALHVLAG
jgi:hypothetical protein